MDSLPVSNVQRADELDRSPHPRVNRLSTIPEHFESAEAGSGTVLRDSNLNESNRHSIAQSGATISSAFAGSERNSFAEPVTPSRDRPGTLSEWLRRQGKYCSLFSGCIMMACSWWVVTHPALFSQHCDVEQGPNHVFWSILWALRPQTNPIYPRLPAQSSRWDAVIYDTLSFSVGWQVPWSSTTLLCSCRWIHPDDCRALLTELHQSTEAGQAEVWYNVVHSRFPDKRRHVVLLHVWPPQHHCRTFPIKKGWLLLMSKWLTFPSGSPGSPTWPPEWLRQVPASVWVLWSSARLLLIL